MSPLAKLLEAALFASSRPVPLDELRALDADASPDDVQAALEGLRAHYDDPETGHSFELVEQGGGWQLLTRAEYSEAIERAQLAQRPQRLSAASLETLAIIAYRQPIGRAEVEEIRGVSVGGVLKALLERGPLGRARPSAAVRHHAGVPGAVRAAPPRGAAARRRAGDRPARRSAAALITL